MIDKSKDNTISLIFKLLPICISLDQGFARDIQKFVSIHFRDNTEKYIVYMIFIKSKSKFKNILLKNIN